MATQLAAVILKPLPMNESDAVPSRSLPGGSQQSDVSPELVQFEALAQGKSELLIEYKGQTYLLKVTKNGKLLLNK